MKKTVIILEILVATVLLVVLLLLVVKLNDKNDVVETPRVEDNDNSSIDTSKVDICKYDDIIISCAREFDIPLGLLYAVIECESDFRPECTSSVGARGLMQLMDETFTDSCKWGGFDYTIDQITDPYVNVRCGSYYFRRMYNMFGDWELAAAAYNAGPGNVQKWLKNDKYSEDGKLVNIPFSETSRYVEKIADRWEKYDKILKG